MMAKENEKNEKLLVRIREIRGFSMIVREMLIKPKFYFLIVLSLVLLPTTGNAQHATKLALLYSDVFDRVELDQSSQDLVDKLMIKYFKKVDEPFEWNDRDKENFKKEVFSQLPDSIKSEIPYNIWELYMWGLKDYYVLGKNGYSKAYNEQVINFSSYYYLEGMSEKGLETFVYQYPAHMSTLFQPERDAFKPVSPVVLKQKVLTEYKKYFSEDDLIILGKGWDSRIQDFAKQEQKRDSAYLASLTILKHKIDSLRNVHFQQLKDSSTTLIKLLSQDELAKWKAHCENYSNTIRKLHDESFQGYKEYNFEFAPNIWHFSEYFYNLKLIFPSSNFWVWRKGPRLAPPAAVANASSFYLTAYRQLEETFVDFIDQYSARIGFPNYYFVGSGTLTPEKKKNIQLVNAVMFAVMHEE